jgi:fructokinase
MSDHAPQPTRISPDAPFEFVGIGEILVDLLSEQITDALASGDSFQTFIGGQVTNIALNLSQLGVRTALLGAVGRDPLGAFCRNELQRRGVNVSYVRTSNDFPTSLVIVGRSRQTPWFTSYISAYPRLKVENVPLDVVRAARVVHTSARALGHAPLRDTVMAVIRAAAAEGRMITLDPNYHQTLWDSTDPHEVLAQAFRYVSLTKPSLDDCRRLFGLNHTPEEYIQQFHTWGARWVVLTRGGEGALVSDATTITELPLPPVDVVDVTGAGDAFWSGMHLALLNEQPLLTAARAGINLAAHKVQHVGPLQATDMADVAHW